MSEELPALPPGPIGGSDYNIQKQYLTPRDLFAAAALIGLISGLKQVDDPSLFNGEGADLVWRIADQMLAAKGK